MRPIVLIGPQRHRPTVSRVLGELGIEGPVAMVTAGWQEREPDDEELVQHVAIPAVNLALYGRAQACFGQDHDLFDRHRERQRTLRRLQEVYRIRLDYAMDAVHDLHARRGRPEIYEPEREAALAAVSQLDTHHLERVQSIHREYDEEVQLEKRPSVMRHRDELRADLERCQAILIAGGHVAVLLNRMRLFGLSDLIQQLPVVAWSAGAMAIAERVVLFHDSPPQGAGYAEVLELGLGLAPRIVPLPHAKRRLRLDDSLRVSMFARRFAPSEAITLDENSRIRWDGNTWVCAADSAAQKLLVDGELTAVEAA